MELLVELLGATIRLVSEFLSHFVFELLVRGAGYRIRRPFSRRAELDDGWNVAAGLAFWAVAVAVGYLVYVGMAPTPP